MKINLRSMSRLESTEPERLVTRLSGARTAQFGAGAVGVILLAGAFIGGSAGHAGLAKSSNQTWLEDGPRGELVEIDTASGQAQQRLTVAARGDELVVHQRAGNLLVQDRTTGTLRSIDLTTLLAEGERQVRPGDDTVVILDGPRVAVAERAEGVIQGIDPISSASVGAPFSVGGPLTAAVADNSGHVWALSTTGRLDELAWGGAGYKLRDSIQVKGAGDGSGLSAHNSGVTVMVTPTGTVEEAADNATGTTDVRAASGLASPVLVGPSTPPGIVPAASNGTSVVVIATPTGVVQPDVAAAGCAHPLAPVVFDNRIYVPCDQSPVVVVLNTDGSSAGPPLTVPAGHTPELSVVNGTLVVNVPGASSVVLVNPKGTSTSVGTEPPGIPTTSQSDPAPVPSPSTPPASKEPKPNPSKSASQPSKSADAAPTLGVSLSPGRPRDGSIAIAVDWSVTHGSQVSKFLVTVAVDGGTSQTQQVNANKRSAVITVPCPTSCSGTASVALMDTSGQGPTSSRSWTSVAPDPGSGGSHPSPGSTPGGGLPGSGNGGGNGDGNGNGAGGSGGGQGGTPAPSTPVIGSVSPVSPGASITPTPDPTGPTPTPAGSPARPSPTSEPVKPTTPASPPVVKPTTPAPQPTTAAPVQTTPAPVQTTPAAPPPTSAAPPPIARPTAGETLITGAVSNSMGTFVTLTITEPADWAASGASCAIMNDGDDGATGTFTCNSTTSFTERETTYSSDSEDYYVRATLSDGSTVDSAHRSIVTREPGCTGTGRCCNSANISADSQSAPAAAEPAVATRQYGVMPDQIAPCP